MFNYFKELLKEYLKMAYENQGKSHLIREFNVLWRGYSKFVQIISKKVFSYLVCSLISRTAISYQLENTVVFCKFQQNSLINSASIILVKEIYILNI